MSQESILLRWESKMGTISFLVSFLLSAFLLNSLLHNGLAVAEELAGSKREALEIIIGGGGSYGPAPSPECPPPPPPPEPECPPPPSPPPPPPPPSPPPPSPPPPSPPPPSPPPPSPPPPSPPPPSPPPPSPPPPSPPPPSPPPPSPPPPSPPPPRPPTTTRLQRAKRVLLEFTLNINDPNQYTKNWRKDVNVCKFNGVRCATFPKSTEKAVAGLDLNRAGISGKDYKALVLPGLLDRLPELAFFHVNSNNFSGAVPNKIIGYPYFFELDLSNNKMYGEFPKEVLGAKQLVFLDLRFNQLYGPVPPQLFQMKLDVIFINNNQFSQNLPENFGSTPARYLTFANNRFTGPIPRSIGLAAKTLTEVLFLGNQFSGCLPYEIGYLKKATLFDVSKNWLTGPIPHSFACLDNIIFLNLAHNQFYGPVPEMVCQLQGLRNNGKFSLSGNYFTQVGPECWKLIQSKVLDVSKNCIQDLPNQRPPRECTDFFSKVKPCPNQKSLNYIPCKKYYSSSQRTSQNAHQATASPPAPVTYKSLKPHRS